MGHMSYDCPNQPGHGAGNSGGNVQAPPNRAQVNFCSTLQPVNDDSVVCNIVIQSGQKSSEVSDSRADSPPVSSETWKYGYFPEFEESAVCAPAQGKVNISPFKIVNVTVEGKPARALKDSFTHIPLISQELASELNLESIGNVMVRGIFRHPVVALLSSVGIELTAEPGTTNITFELPVVCAVVEMNAKEYDVIYRQQC